MAAGGEGGDGRTQEDEGERLMNFVGRKVNAGIAARRSVLTRTVFDHDGSRLHIFILGCPRAGDKSTHENSRGEQGREGR